MDLILAPQSFINVPYLTCHQTAVFASLIRIRACLYKVYRYARLQAARCREHNDRSIPGSLGPPSSSFILDAASSCRVRFAAVSCPRWRPQSRTCAKLLRYSDPCSRFVRLQTLNQQQPEALLWQQSKMILVQPPDAVAAFILS